ncbi:MAG: hypothetical protein ACI4M9_04355, partial [Succinivibrio sp.]
MKLNIRLLAPLVAAFVLLTGAVSTYNYAAIYKSSVKGVYTYHRDYIKAVSSAINANVSKNNGSEDQALSSLFANTQYLALEKFHQFYGKQDFLDISAFQYFADSNATDQFFESSIELPKGMDCLDTLKVPSNLKAKVSAVLAKDRLSTDAFWCSTEKGKSFLGYRLLNINDKNYLYVEKLKNDDFYHVPNLKDKIAKLDLKKLLSGTSDKYGTAITLLNKDLKAVASSKVTTAADNRSDYLNLSSDVKATDTEAAEKTKRLSEISDLFSHVDKEYFKKAKESPLTAIQTEMDTEKASLLSIAYIEPMDSYIVITSNKGAVVKPVITGNFIVCILALLLVSLLICMYLKYIRTLKKEIRSIGNNIDVMATNVLSPLAAMDEVTSKIDESRLTTPKLKELNSSLCALGRSICENVAAQRKELEDKAIEDSHTAATNAELSLVANLHSSLMPNAANMPNSKFLEVASFMVASKTNPSDFYDIFRVDRDNLGIIFGSCNKTGIEAVSAISLVSNFLKMGMVDKTMLPGDVLTDLNKLLMQRAPNGLCVSVVVMILSEFTGNFIYAVAGKKLPML